VNFYSPDIKNSGEFFTDSNGLEMQQRKLNSRDGWSMTHEPGMNITSNFYPVTSAIAIRDENI
jgi:alpha-mannosidase